MHHELAQFKLVTAARDKVVEARKKAGVNGITRGGKSKKIVALSCGSKNGYCETFLKAAAMGAEEFGMETEIIRGSALTVNPCMTCHGCTSAFAQGKLAKGCPIKDDARWILEKCVLEDNALILAAPVFHLMSNALLLALAQRMHPVMFNNLELLRDRKVAGIISVAAGMDGWSSFGLTVPHIWVEHFARVVDQIDIGYRFQTIDWFERARELGRNVGRAMTIPIEEVTYAGDQSAFACPVCHCDVLRMPDEKPRPPYPGEFRHKPSDVVCPICWVHGSLSRNGSKLMVAWDEWDVEHPRFSEYGVFEHLDVILGNNTPGSDLYLTAHRDLKERYASYGTFIER